MNQVCEINCSMPEGKQVTMRPLTKAERAQQKRDLADHKKRAAGEAYVRLRVVRDSLLLLTDHYAGEPAWDRWRQRLRDLPSAVKNPEKPAWPKPPKAASCIADYRSLWPRLDWTPLTKGSR